VSVLWVEGAGEELKWQGGPWLGSENNNQGPRGTATFLLAGRGEPGEVRGGEVQELRRAEGGREACVQRLRKKKIQKGGALWVCCRLLRGRRKSKGRGPAVQLWEQRRKSRGGGRLPRVQEMEKCSAPRVFLVAFFNCKITPLLSFASALWEQIMLRLVGHWARLSRFSSLDFGKARGG